jgi:hypothetical protein
MGKAILTVLFFVSAIAVADPRNTSCSAFLEAHARSFDGNTSGYPKLFGFYGDTGVPVWINTREESWQNSGSVHEMHLPIDAPGVRPLGEVKVTTDKENRIKQVQEMSFVRGNLVLGTEINLDYSSDGFCRPKKMFNFLISHQKFEITEVLFELDKCQMRNSNPDCTNREISQALNHMDSAPQNNVEEARK